MTIPEYLIATGRTQLGLAEASGVPQQTIQQVIARKGACRIDVAAKLVDASLREPAPNGGHITFEDLASGALEYHKAPRAPRGDGAKPKKRRKPPETAGKAAGKLPLDVKPKVKPPSEPAIALCEDFSTRLRRRMIFAKIPSGAQGKRAWAAHFDKLMSESGASVGQVQVVLDVLDDPGHFWHSKLDTPKQLRTRFAALYADAKARGPAQAAAGATISSPAEQRRVADRERVVRELMGRTDG